MDSYLSNRQKKSEEYNSIDWHALFLYNEEDGLLTAKHNSTSRVKGATVGWLTSAGYIRFKHDKREWFAHRVIYVMCYGSIPYELEVDHKNRIRSDNRLFNLRAVTRLVNGQNIKQDDWTGVRLLENGKYRSDVMFKGKWYTAGMHFTFEDAYLSRQLLRESLYNGSSTVPA